MAKIKVLFLETHYKFKGTVVRTHGVDFARVVNPAKALMSHPDFEVELRKDPIENSNQKDWDEITKHFDLIFCSYIDSPAGYVHLALHSKKNKKPFIIDLDDNLWEIPQESPTFNFYHPGSEGLHFVSKALEDAPFIATTNLYLKRKIVDFCKKPHNRVKVLPNFIDLKLYDYKKGKRVRSNDEIIIGFFGTNTHVIDMFSPDFSEGLRQVLSEHPNVIFETTGFFLPQLKTWFKRQYRFRNGEPDIYNWVNKWVDLMANTDIVVAPLRDTDFNRCKSGIKYLEYSAAKKPGVYQDIRQYQEILQNSPKKCGYLAHNKEQWYKALKELVVSESTRQLVGNNAYQLVKDKHTIQGNINLYADYFNEVIAEYGKSANLIGSGFIIPE